MSQTIAQRDGNKGASWWPFKLPFGWRGWSGWRSDQVSDVIKALDRWVGPWQQPSTDRPTDIDRTKALAAVNCPVDVNPGVEPWMGSVGGQPINLAGRQMQSVLNRTSGTDLDINSGQWGMMPLPPTTLREGDPVGAWDYHLRLFDPASGALWEAIQAHRRIDGMWTVGYPGARAGLVKWDTTVPYDPHSAPAGVVAIGTPHTPYLARWDEVEAGEIRHQGAAVFPNYHPDRTGAARWSDGTALTSPVRGGELLRLTAAAHQALVAKYRGNRYAITVLNWLRDYGVVCIDRRGHKPAPADGTVDIRTTMDPRWAQLPKMPLQLTQFEVVLT